MGARWEQNATWSEMRFDGRTNATARQVKGRSGPEHIEGPVPCQNTMCCTERDLAPSGIPTLHNTRANTRVL